MGKSGIIQKSILIVLLFSISIFAQGEAALPFMTMPNSVISYGSGNIGTSLLFKDVMGAHYNPALVGYLAQESNFGYQIVSSPVKRAPIFNVIIQQLNYGFSAGYNLKSKYNLPISIGISMQRQQIDYGAIKNERSFDFANNYSFGIGWNWLIDVYAGISFKNSESQLVDIDGKAYKATPKFTDYGIIVNIPMDKLVLGDQKINLDNKSYLVPNIDFSIGYSYLNVGDNIAYVDVSQSDPGPRTARLGYTFEFGANLKIDNDIIGFINYSFTAEAEDILVKPWDYMSGDRKIEYDGIFGKIIPFKHLISLKPDINTIVHKGHILRFFDSVYLLFGSYAGRGWNYPIKSNGIGISTEGFGKLLIDLTGNKIIKNIFSHFEVQYYKSTTFTDDIRQTNYDGIYLYLNNILL